MARAYWDQIIHGGPARTSLGQKLQSVSDEFNLKRQSENPSTVPPLQKHEFLKARQMSIEPASSDAAPILASVVVPHYAHFERQTSDEAPGDDPK